MTIVEFLAWPVIILVTTGGITSYLVGNTSTFALSPVSALIISTAAMAAFFSPLALLSVLGGRWSWLRTSPRVLVVAVTLGAAVRGVTIWAAHRTLNIDEAFGLSLQILASVLAIVPIALVNGAIVVAFANYRDAQHKMMVLETQLTELDDYAEEYIRQFVRESIEKTHLGFAEVMTALKHIRLDTSGNRALAAMRRVSDDVVTPLSRNLRLPHTTLPEPTPVPRFPRIDWTQLWRTVLDGKPHLPAVTGSLFGVGVLPHTLATVQPAVALLLSVTWGLAIAGLLMAQNAILDAFPSTTARPLRIIMVLFLAGLGTIALIALAGLMTALFDLPPASELVLLNVAVNLPPALFLLALGRALLMQIRAAIGKHAETEAAFSAKMTRANELFWQRRSALSNALHGPVQAALNAAELRIRVAQDNGHLDEVLTEELTKTLNEALGAIDAVEETRADLALTLKRIKHAWEGLCEVNWSVPMALLDTISSRPESAGIADLLVEAVFNAVRHASARHVDITMALESSPAAGDELVIEVSNDGRSARLSRHPGQGSELFDLLTQHWSLTPISNDSRMTSLLHLDVPLAEPLSTTARETRANDSETRRGGGESPGRFPAWNE